MVKNHKVTADCLSQSVHCSDKDKNDRRNSGGTLRRKEKKEKEKKEKKGKKDKKEKKGKKEKKEKKEKK